MKTIKTILAATILTGTMLFAASCKKDKPAEPTTQEKIIGKWNLQNVIQNDHYSGSDHINTIAGGSADYYDFRNDGKVYGYVGGSYDTAAYGIVDNNHLWIDDHSEVYEIKALTTSALQLYQKVIMGTDEYFEATVNLYK